MNLDNKLIDSVKGFLDRKEGLALYECAKEAGRLGPCLEIGSYCGKSALYLGAGCRASGSILFSVDHHRGSEEQQPGEEYFDPETYDIASGFMDTFPLFKAAVSQARLEDTVVPIVCESSVAARMWATPLSLVFIDGGHSEGSAMADYEAWSGHLMPGGYLLIHDIFKNPEEGGQAPYHIYCRAVSSGLFSEIPMIGTLGVLKRI
ncbi:MAG: class I SAM-dependent methyltransferase [Deltaproteobacteria bacterium]|nr:class I SAM-dependent methyltransferase [Deltaproteobacteria bacterium]